MNNNWNDEDITKALKDMANTEPDSTVFQRVWFKVEERLASGHHHAIVWHPWLHPVRWVVAAASLCLAFSGFLYHGYTIGQNDMASYLLSRPDPVATVTAEPGVRVPILLKEPSNKSIDILAVQENMNPLAGVEIFL